MLQQVAETNPALSNNPWFRRALGESTAAANQQIMAHAIQEHAKAYQTAVYERASVEVGDVLRNGFQQILPDYSALKAAFDGILHKAGIKNPGDFVLDQVQAEYKRRVANGDFQGASDFLNKAGEVQVGPAKISQGIYASRFQSLREDIYGKLETNQKKSDREDVRALHKVLSTLPEAIAVATPAQEADKIANFQSFKDQLYSGKWDASIKPEFRDDALKIVAGRFEVSRKIDKEAQQRYLLQHGAALRQGSAGSQKAIILETLILTGEEQQQALENRAIYDAKVRPHIQGKIERALTQIDGMIQRLSQNGDAVSQATVEKLTNLREGAEESIFNELPNIPANEVAAWRATKGLPMAQEALDNARKLLKEPEEAVLNYRKNFEADYILKNKDGLGQLDADISNKVIPYDEGMKLRQWVVGRTRGVVESSAEAKATIRAYRANIASTILDISKTQPTLKNKLGGPWVQLGLVQEDPNRLIQAGDIGAFGNKPRLPIQLTPDGKNFIERFTNQIEAAWEKWKHSPEGIVANDGTTSGFQRAAQNELDKIIIQAQEHLDGLNPLSHFDPYSTKTKASATGIQTEKDTGKSEVEIEDLKKAGALIGNPQRNVTFDREQNFFVESDLEPQHSKAYPNINYTNLRDVIKDVKGASIIRVLESPTGRSHSSVLLLQTELGRLGANRLKNDTMFRQNEFVDLYSQQTFPVSFHPNAMAAFVLKQSAMGSLYTNEFKDFSKRKIGELMTTISQTNAIPQIKTDALLASTLYTGLDYKDVIRGSAFGILLPGQYVAFQFTPLFNTEKELNEVLANPEVTSLLFQKLGLGGDSTSVRAFLDIFTKYQIAAIRRIS